MNDGDTGHGGWPAALMAWYAAMGRHDLPWRRTRDPYAVLVSEVMLQQTQVERVLPKYAEFLAAFPTLEALADAPVAEVIRRWGSLGYNRRAVRLRLAARAAIDAGGLPSGVDALRALPGCGPYTAAAVACFAFGAGVAVVDTNVRRVLGRAVAGDAAISDAAARRIGATLVPPGQGRDWALALMDLGATVCTARAPSCGACPLASTCVWLARAAPARPQPSTARPEPAEGRANAPARPEPVEGRANAVRETRAPYRPRASERFVGSRRWYRGRVVAALRELAGGASIGLTALGAAVREGYDEAEHGAWLRELLAALIADGLAASDGERASLPPGP